MLYLQLSRAVQLLSGVNWHTNYCKWNRRHIQTLLEKVHRHSTAGKSIVKVSWVFSAAVLHCQVNSGLRVNVGFESFTSAVYQMAAVATEVFRHTTHKQHIWTDTLKKTHQITSHAHSSTHQGHWTHTATHDCPYTARQMRQAYLYKTERKEATFLLLTTFTFYICLFIHLNAFRRQ